LELEANRIGTRATHILRHFGRRFRNLILLLATIVASPSCATPIYVSASNPGRVLAFDSSSGQSLGQFATIPARSVWGLAFDKSGNLYVAGDSNVFKYSPGGQLLETFASTSPSQQYLQLAFDRTEHLYAGRTLGGPAGAVDKIRLSGRNIGVLSGIGIPLGLAVGKAQDLFLVDESAAAIRKFSRSGEALGIVASGLSSPQGLAFDTSNHLFLGEEGNVGGNNSPGSIIEFSQTGRQLAAFYSPKFYVGFALTVSGSTIFVIGQSISVDGSGNHPFEIHQFGTNGTDMGTLVMLGDDDELGGIAMAPNSISATVHVPK
jgi:hypothetical protein